MNESNSRNESRSEGVSEACVRARSRRGEKGHCTAPCGDMHNKRMVDVHHQSARYAHAPMPTLQKPECRV